MQRLSAHARLDDSPSVLAHARTEAAAGDDSWQQWVAEYERGEALILRLELELEFVDETREVLRTTTAGFFVESDPHLPRIEQQVAELAAGDVAGLAAELARRGRELDAQELSAMYVHVELDEQVRGELLARRRANGGRERAEVEPRFESQRRG